MLSPLTLGVAALGAAIFVTAYFVIAALLVFYINRMINSYKMAQSTASDVGESVLIYQRWVLAAAIDAIFSIIVSAINAAYQVYSITLNYGWVIIGVAFLMPFAIGWTEYHPEAIGVMANVYQCGIARLFYDFPIMRFLNILRLLYDTAWPFLRFIARFTRLLMRSIPQYMFGCTGWKFFQVFLYAANFVVDIAKAFVTWVAGPGSVMNQTLNTTQAWHNLLQIQEPVLGFLNCGCVQLDFVWIIGTEWMAQPSTAMVLSSLLAGLAEILAIALRTLLGINLGTFPGVTASWGYLPNPTKMFDMLIVAIYAARVTVNYEIYVIVRELVGTFDSSIFVPGSDGTTLLLTSNWIGAVAEIVVGAVEVARKWSHIIGIGAALLVQGVIFLFSLLAGPGYLAPFGPPVYCDLREWKAALDYGGPASLYNKQGGPFGAAYRALDEVCLLLDTASPYICDIVGPPLKGLIDVSNAVGIGFVTLALMLLLPVSLPVIVPIYLFLIPIVIPFVIVRLIFHLIDSEWRMFSPPIPPRTGEPLTTWTGPPTYLPPPSLTPPPLAVCVGAGNAYPGFFWPWVQHYVEDPDGIHLLVIDDAERFAFGMGNVTSLIAPGLGIWFRNLLAAPVYTYDIVVQSIFFANVLLFSDVYQKAIFVQRWRYARFIDGIYGIASGFRDFLATFDPLSCGDGPLSIRRFFCAAGDAVAQYIAVFRGIAFQLLLILITAFVPPLNIPNFTETIVALQATINDLIMLFLAIVIPPYPFNGSLTLTDIFQSLFSNAASVIVLPLDLLNYIFYSIAVFFSSGCPTISACTTSFGSLVKNLLTYFLQQLALRFGYGVFVGLGVFFDTLIGATGCEVEVSIPTGCIFTRFFRAIVDTMVTISNLVTSFALALFQYIVAVVGATIGLFFSDDQSTFDVRLTRFLDALWNLIKFTIFRLPLLALQLIFGIIGVILPPPLGNIIVTIGTFLVQGLCYIIQFFITTIIFFINLFGAQLPEINMCCDGSAECAPSLKRTHGPNPRRYTDTVAEEARNLVNKVVNKASMSHSQFKDRFQRMEKAFEKHVGKRKRNLQPEPAPFDSNLTLPYMEYLDPSQHTVDFDSYFDPLITSNNSASSNSSAEPVHLNLDEAMAMLADMVSWDGVSVCDVFVKGLTNESSVYFKAPKDYTLIEHVTIRDCILKRTVGEIFSIMPYFQWFPADGFYNSISWLKLGGDAVHAYLIYTQYQSDRQMPREMVLAEPYIEGWRKSGLDTSHYTDEMYPVFMTNWTLLTYFQINNGNTAIADMLVGYWNALSTGIRTQANFLDNLFASVKSNDPSEIEAWLLGQEAFDRTLSPDLQQAHLFWRAAIGIMNATWTVTTGSLKAIYDNGVIGSGFAAAVEMPQTLKRGYQWYQGLDKDVAWQHASMKRDIMVQREVGYAIKRSDFGLLQMRSILPRLSTWASGRLQTLRTKLTTANSPRAKRNWNVIKHMVAETRDTVWGERITVANVPTVAPAGLAPSQVPIWAERVREVAAYNTYLNSINSSRIRRRVPTYATGATTQGRNYTFRIASNGSFVVPLSTSTGGEEFGDIFSFFTGALNVCNSSLVPVCLNCTILDAIFQELLIGIDEISDYFNTTNQYANANALYDGMEAYLNGSSPARVCGGTGSQPILFPSSMQVWGTTTLFEVMGGQQGAAVGTINFVRSLFPTISDAVATTASYTQSAFVLASALASSIRNSEVTLASLSSRAVDFIKTANTSTTTENRIYDYAQTHAGLDTTYLLFDIFYILKPFLLIIDAVWHMFTNFSVSFRSAIDPITNSTTSIPVFDDTGDTNVIGFLWTRTLAVNWAYTCDQRNMSLLQGLFYTGLAYLIIGIFVSLTVGLISTMAASVIFGILIPLFPWAFFRLTYNWGLRSLLWLPFPLFPPCMADDVMEAAVCHIIPKCPAVWSGMVDGPYTEANCMSCPTSFRMRNCKRQLLIADGLDWIVLFVQWLYPPAISMVAQFIGMGTSDTALLGGLINRLGLMARLTKFSNVDFGDVSSFNAYTSCAGVMSLSTIPGLVITLIVLSIFISAITVTAISVLYKLIKIPIAVYFLYTSLINAIVIEYVYVVTRNDALAIRAALTPENDSVRAPPSSLNGITVDEGDISSKAGLLSSYRKKKMKKDGAARAKGLFESLRSRVKSLWESSRQFIAEKAEAVASSVFWQMVMSTRPIKRGTVRRMIDNEKLRHESRRIGHAMRSNDSLRYRGARTAKPPSPFDNF